MSKWQKYNDWAEALGWCLLIAAALGALVTLLFLYTPGRL